MNNQQNIQIKASDDDLKGRYANMAQVTHTKEEFVLSFMNVLPPAGMLVSRMILNPAHAKRLMKVLSEQIKGYEAAFGKLDESEPPKTEFGFKA